MSVLGRAHWFLELFSHFRAQAGLCILAAAVACALGRRWVASVGLGLASAVMLASIAWLWVPDGRTGTGETIATVMGTNLLGSNRDHAALRQLVASERPDLIVAVEVTPHWRRALDQLPHYPHRFHEPPTHHALMGGSLLSRWPIREAAATRYAPGAEPLLRAVIDLPSGPLVVYGAHPFPPTNARLARGRNAYLRDLATRVHAEQHPVVLLGDFNAAPTSPYLADLLRDAQLHDTRQGFGLQASWPRPISSPFKLALQIPIDHIFTSPHLRTTRRWLGPTIGSDHAPVFATLERTR